jgi:4-amino-4-deoxy-L-arabinose transferase-like glycosyltransferase
MTSIDSNLQSPSCELSSNTLQTPRITRLDIFLLGSILIVLLWGVGAHGLYEPHEGHFAGVGREMVTRGDWVTPHLNGAPYLNKPPLMYWIIASSYTIFGEINEWAARVPLALIGWCGVILVWHWARQLFGAKAGRYAAIMLAVSAGWYLFCHQLLIDALLSVLLLGSSYAFWKITLKPESWPRWIIFYGICGLAILAKGPIGIALPGLMALIWVIWRRKWSYILRWEHLAGLLLCTVMVAPWCFLLEKQNPGAISYMLVNENFNRVLDQRWPPDYSVVKVGPIVYVIIAMVWMAPWSLILPQTLSFSWKKSRLGAKQESSRAVADALLILAITWLLPILIFLPMPSRLVYYCVPSVLPFSILAAGWWNVAEQECYQKGRQWASWTLLGVGLVIFSAGFWVGGLLKPISFIQAMPSMLTYISHLCFALGVALTVGSFFLLLQRKNASIAALGILLAATQIYNVQGFSEFDTIWSSRKTVAALSVLKGEEVTWITEGSKEIGAAGGIAYYLGLDSHKKSRQGWVMKDSPGREPPIFPGPVASYLIDKKRLAEMWIEDKPIVYLTDFQRTEWEFDPASLPMLDDAHKTELHEIPEITPTQTGNRKVFVNEAAWKIWNKR